MGENRGNARQRGYSRTWDKACATFKQRNPNCLGCSAIGKQTRTEVVDHVVPHKGDQAKFWDTSLWQSACACHHSIKARLERQYERGELTVADLWLNSPAAVAMSKRYRLGDAVATTLSSGWVTSMCSTLGNLEITSAFRPILSCRGSRHQTNWLHLTQAV
jgi:5-methylcytosine-specific restriction protein A